jgi:hypothetical protein
VTTYNATYRGRTVHFRAWDGKYGLVRALRPHLSPDDAQRVAARSPDRPPTPAELCNWLGELGLVRYRDTDWRCGPRRR